MTERTKGIVRKIGKSQYSFFIQLDGDQRYYNTKFEPKCKEGDEVGIEFEPKGDARANIKQVKIFKAGARPQSTPSSGGGRSYGSESGGDRQASIIWQHSQEIAVRTLEALVGAGALPLGGKDADKQAQVLAYLDELTYRFYKDAADPLKSETYKREAGVEEDKAPEKTPEDGGWGDDAEEPSEGEEGWGGGWD